MEPQSYHPNSFPTENVEHHTPIPTQRAPSKSSLEWFHQACGIARWFWTLNDLNLPTYKRENPNSTFCSRLAQHSYNSCLDLLDLYTIKYTNKNEKHKPMFQLRFVHSHWWGFVARMVERYGFGCLLEQELLEQGRKREVYWGRWGLKWLISRLIHFS